MSARRRRQHLKAWNVDAWKPEDHNARVAVRKARRRFGWDPGFEVFLVEKYGFEWVQRYRW